MTIIELAHAVGVGTTNARRRAKRLGITVQDRHGYIDLRERDIQTLSASLATARRCGDCLLPDNPGLPIRALSDPNMREAFTRMRFEREHRLHALVSRV